ncbi:restriction endonuclease subunit S [Clostridium paraputrificum]|uniref:restriction endonuclease subunit S n=1 Tax=Clostridium paraputrificum TaxID=29363 RepID=UPI00189D969F|nr:restriction endonuclease subunit S [Clostridium paraputrificum]
MCKEMKTCSIKWFGKIPSEWKIVKVKRLFNIGRGRVIAQTELDDNGAYPVYSSQTKNNGCLGYINTYDFDKKQLTWTTDGANAGTVFLREGKYNCTNVCGTLLPKNEENNLAYLKYILEYTAIFHKRADTNGFKIMNNEMAEISILLPNKVEQDEIANYLNKKVSQIDDIISKQKSLIEKYKAYKQSLITETVTKGLNKNVPMKDSGIEWIGEIPSHWEIKSMKYLCSCNDDSLTSSEDENMCINYVDISSVTFESGIVNYEEMLFKNAPSRARRVTQYGDIIISTVRTYLKAIAIIPDDKRYIVSTGFAVIRAKYILNRYLDYFVKSEYFINLVSLYSKGISYPAIDSFDLMNIKILEPSIDEQEKIADFLDKKCNAINLAIAKKEQLIEKLESYKNSLIYEYVTGKREVM